MIGALVGGLSSYWIQRHAERERRQMRIDDFQLQTLLQVSDAMSGLFLALTASGPALATPETYRSEEYAQRVATYRSALMRFGTLMFRVHDETLRRQLADVYAAAEHDHENPADPQQFDKSMFIATPPLNERIRSMTQ